MFTTLHISINERAVLVRHGLPVRALAPGKHTVWGAGVTIHRLNTDELVLVAPPAIRAVLPPEWIKEITLGPRERAIVLRDGRPVKFLRPGTHRVWAIDPTVEIRVLDVDHAPPELTDELRAVIPAGELIDATVQQHQRGLLYVNGRFVRLLEPGRHVLWTHTEARVTIAYLDVRQQQITLAGQDLMTKDKVTLRLTLTAEYAPADAPLATHAVADVKDALYLLVQLAARDYVAGVTLDELLEGRDAMTRYLEAQVQPAALQYGVAVRRVGVKDVVLPGEMKTILNRVIEAEKQAAANVILRREDAAATRNMVTTAKVIADNPVLLRLKELEALEKIATEIDEVKVTIGDDAIKLLMPPR
ncbi:MAG TPA: slipin family protein [Kofleriaceae bacterium]|jgi:regulator of protease activity HflC (stomatin/prohibitin superfamily)|nr:slipin family protein [Kofleriaceae bacterium]